MRSEPVTPLKDPKVQKLHAQAEALFEKKQVSEAMPLLEEAVALAGDDASAELLSDFGRALSSSNRAEEALEAFDRAIDLDGKTPKYRLNRAILKERMGRLGEVEEDLTAVLETEPERIEVRWMLIRALLANDDLIGAQVQLDLLLEQNPSDAGALCERARINIKLVDFDSAKADLDQVEAMEEVPENVRKVLEVAKAELAEAGGEADDASGDRDAAHDSAEDPDLADLLGAASPGDLKTPLQATVTAGLLVAVAGGGQDPLVMREVKHIVVALMPEASDDELNKMIPELWLNLQFSDPNEFVEHVAEVAADARARANAFLVAASVAVQAAKVSQPARELLGKLAEAFELPPSAIDRALQKARTFTRADS